MTTGHIRVIDLQQLHGISLIIQTVKVNSKVEILSRKAAINTQLRALSNGLRARMQTSTLRPSLPHSDSDSRNARLEVSGLASSNQLVFIWHLRE